MFRVAYLCWRKLSCLLKYLPQTSQENVTSGLLWVRSCIIKLYGLVNRLWQYLQMNSHFGRILRRKSDRQSSLSIRITANIMDEFLFFCFLHFVVNTMKASTSFCASRLVPVRKTTKLHKRLCLLYRFVVCLKPIKQKWLLSVQCYYLEYIFKL